MSLREVYADAWAMKRGLGRGWIVNLEPSYALELGAVGVVKGNDFAPETSLAARGITGLDVMNSDPREGTAWDFQSNDEIRVSVGVKGESGGLGSHLGDVGLELSVDFGSEFGVSAHGTGMWWPQFVDVGVVRSRLIDAANTGALHAGESIVVAQQLTGPGVMFTSQGKNGSLTAEASADVGLGGLPSVASLSGKLSVTKSSEGAQIQNLPNRAVLAARVLFLGTRGWFWWRRFEVFGGTELPDNSADQVLDIETSVMSPVEGTGENEYFAML